MSKTSLDRVVLMGAVSLFLLCSIALGADPDAFRIRVHARDTVELLSELDQAGYDVAGRNGRAGYVELIAGSAELEALRDRGLKVEVVEAYTGKTALGPPAGYHDFDQIETMLMDAQNNYPAIARLVNVGGEYGTGNTHEGRKIYALKISDNVMQEEDEPSVFITCNHHAREVMTPEFGLWAIEKLTTLYGTDPDVTRWVDHNQIYISPTMNPDGLEYCFNVYEWWRKNRKPVGGGYYGVDLNRNFDFNWYGPYSGSSSPSSDTYKGPYPASEEETQGESALILDRHFAKVLDLHSSGSEVLYTYYDPSSFPALLEAWYKNKAVEFADALNYAGSHRKPSAEGEHYQWDLCNAGSLAFLVETGWEFQPPFSTAQAEFNNHIWPGMQWLLDHEIPLRGHVKEAGSGKPIQADIAVKGINYTQGEIRKTEPRFGRYHYFLPPGSYEVTFSAPGYAPQAFDVDITLRKSTLLEAQLGAGPALTVNGNASQGGVLDLAFDWPGGAGHTYLNGVSFVDTGFSFKNGIFVPIGWDFLYQFSLGAFPGWMGNLDGAGHAAANLPLPHDPLLVGLEFFMAFFTVDPGTNLPSGASAAVKIFVDA